MLGGGGADLARVVIALERIGADDPSVSPVEDASGSLGAETVVSAVHSGHVLETEVA